MKNFSFIRVYMLCLFIGILMMFGKEAFAYQPDPNTQSLIDEVLDVEYEELLELEVELEDFLIAIDQCRMSDGDGSGGGSPNSGRLFGIYPNNSLGRSLMSDIYRVLGRIKIGIGVTTGQGGGTIIVPPTNPFGAGGAAVKDNYDLSCECDFDNPVHC